MPCLVAMSKKLGRVLLLGRMLVEKGVDIGKGGPFEERFRYGNVIVMLVEKGDDEQKGCPCGDKRRHPLQCNHPR